MQDTFFAKIKPYRFRILAGLLFCVFLISTWFIFHQKPHFPEVLHISLQEQFRNIVQEKLAEQKPEARNLQFQKLWTEGTKRDQITAHFQYSFDDAEGVSFSVSGKAIMNRKSIDPERKHDLWTIDHIKTNNTNLEFKEPITLFSGNVKMNQDKEKDPEETPTDISEDDEEKIDQKKEVSQKEAKPSKKEEQKNKQETVQELKDIKEEMPKENKKATQEAQKDEEKTTEENKQNETAQEIKSPEKEEVKPAKTQNPSTE